MVTRSRVVSEQGTPYGPEQHSHLDILSDEYLNYVTARVIASLETEALDLGNNVTLNSLTVIETTINGLTEIVSAAPELRFTESGQTDPAGRYRIRLSGDVMLWERALTAAWATSTEAMRLDASGATFLRVSGTVPKIRLNENDQVDPVGQYGFEVDTGIFYLAKALTANWATQINLFAHRPGNTYGVTIKPGGAGESVFIFGNSNESATLKIQAASTVLTLASGFGTLTMDASAHTFSSTVTMNGFDSTAGSLIRVAGNTLELRNTTNQASNQVVHLSSFRSGTAANNDEGYASYTLKDSLAAQPEVARRTWVVLDKTNGSIDGLLKDSVKVNNVLTAHQQLGSDGSALTYGIFGSAPVVRQTRGATLTNSVTSGGTDDTIADFTDLAVYANDAATIRNDIYQLSRILRQHDVALRAYGLET